MSSKIKKSAFLSAVIITLVYAVCWIPFSMFFDNMILFSMSHPVQPAKLQFLLGFLYLSVTTFLVFVLMKNQLRQMELLQSKLEIADETLENRVRLRTAEIENRFSTLNTLKGIIPICANCKSIRNGSGQWEAIERYIQKHSEAEFSHGLCPDCDKELYGNRRLHFETIASKYS